MPRREAVETEKSRNNQNPPPFIWISWAAVSLLFQSRKQHEKEKKRQLQRYLILFPCFSFYILPAVSFLWHLVIFKVTSADAAADFFFLFALVLVPLLQIPARFRFSAWSVAYISIYIYIYLYRSIYISLLLLGGEWDFYRWVSLLSSPLLWSSCHFLFFFFAFLLWLRHGVVGRVPPLLFFSFSLNWYANSSCIHGKRARGAVVSPPHCHWLAIGGERRVEKTAAEGKRVVHFIWSCKADGDTLQKKKKDRRRQEVNGERERAAEKNEGSTRVQLSFLFCFAMVMLCFISQDAAFWERLGCMDCSTDRKIKKET